MTRRSKPDGDRASETAPIEFRPFEITDLDAVDALWRACNLVVSYNVPADDIAFCRDSPTSELFVAAAGDAVAATAMAGHDGHRGWLYYVAVDPARRGDGLGRRIVAHAEAWLADQGVRKVNLVIRDTNTTVQAFYERLGYRAEPRILMARWLVDRPADEKAP